MVGLQAFYSSRYQSLISRGIVANDKDISFHKKPEALLSEVFRTYKGGAFEKYPILFKVKAIPQDSGIGQPLGCPSGRGAWTPRVNAKILTTGIPLSIPRIELKLHFV